MELLFVILGIAVVICIITLVVVKQSEMEWETRTLPREEEDMGETFYELTDEELCELICGDLEEDGEEVIMDKKEV